MKTKHILTACAVATTAFVTSSAAFAAGDNNATAGIGITGTVPTHCEADLSNLPTAIALGEDFAWTGYQQRYNMSVECNTQAPINVTFTGSNTCNADHLFVDQFNVDRDFCLQSTTDANAKIPYAVKAWGRNGAGAACSSDFHRIVNGVAFPLSPNCITLVGDGAWSYYRTNMIVDIIVNAAQEDEKVHIPAGSYSDNLAVLVSW